MAAQRDTYTPDSVEPNGYVAGGRPDWHDVQRTYDQSDESTNFLAEGYNSFGFWEGISPRIPSAGLLAAQQLYDVATEPLNLGTKDRILELGSGLGTGSRYLHDRYQPLLLVGVDFSMGQITKSTAQASGPPRRNLCFLPGDACGIPFRDGTFTAALAVEVLQHIPPISIPKLFREVHRVLAADGRFSFATFFLQQDRHYRQAENLLWTVRGGFDHLSSLDSVCAIAQTEGFSVVESKSIGSHIIPGACEYVSAKTASWREEEALVLKEAALDLFNGFRIAFEQGLIDYYLCICAK